jgi:DDE superfamily endonuclease/Transposase DDE domain
MVIPVGGIAMTKRVPVESAPGPLEDYAAHFDDLFSKRAQREGFRRYLEGLLLAEERNKTLTALANTEPVVGAQRKEAQSLQWFLTESTWDPEEINRRRVELILVDSQTAPQKSGALVIDETGDRKDGKATAHVGKQYLGGIGKVDNGVVSVSSLYADERLYYPLEVEPYTPEHHFEGGKKDPEFRTKPQIAWELVEQALKMELPFRAVVADSLYGENTDFCETLLEANIPFVMALRPSYAWWAPPEQVGNVWEAALVSTVSSWGGPEQPGDWVGLERSFRDGRVQQWWALEAEGGPYGPERSERLVVVTTDPATLPERSTSYLVTNLPAPDSERAQKSQHSVADLAEVARLYALRSWIEQSYKQVKNSLGWAHYQVRKDISIRRHWQLVCCAFSFCWWACAECEDIGSPPVVVLKDVRYSSIAATEPDGGEKTGREGVASIMAEGTAEDTFLAPAVRNAPALLESVYRTAPAQRVPGVAR